jgi:ubiquitin carboxyl-terminal hydrolase 36/42
MNAILQCLAYSPGPAYFAEHIPNIIYEANLSSTCFLHHFGQLCSAMRIANPVPPHIFFENIEKICPGMKAGQQQDAHEFLFSLLNLFDTECQRAFGRTHGRFDTAIHAIFGGTLGEIRTCESCAGDLETESRFLDITLPIESETIEGCFEQMLQGQKSSECFCKRCRRKRNFSNRSLFRETPQVLIVTMMRFTANGTKIEKPVNFALEIDLSPFVARGVHSDFELFGVVVHNGHDLNRGHFLSYVRSESGIWYSANDTHVTKIAPNVVLMSRPYIMFYKRKVVAPEHGPVIVTFGISDDDSDD